MHKSDTVCHKLRRKTENNRLREYERSVWPLVWWGVLVLAKGRTGKISISQRLFWLILCKVLSESKIWADGPGDPANQLGDWASDPERQAGDETQLQNPSPRHRRVWQVDFHEEPQGCPWLRLLHEGEARCPWSKFEHVEARPRVFFYVFHRWLSATWSSLCTWFCVRWTFKRWTFDHFELGKQTWQTELVGQI